jgi:hypothetical protein
LRDKGIEMRNCGSVVGTALTLIVGCSSSGGEFSTAGTPPGNSEATGAVASGAVIPTAGTSTTNGEGGGAAGTSPTLVTGAGGMSPVGGPNDLGSVWKSSGCGKALPAKQVTTVPGSRIGYTAYHVQQTGVTLGEDQPDKAVDRQFFVRVPVDYNPNKAYRVVYEYQNCGPSPSEGNIATYPLFDQGQGGTEQAVYVAVSLPPNHPNNSCFDNRAGTLSQEWEAFQLFHDEVEATYCVDNNRIFMSGYGSGGWVSHMFSCYFGGIPTPPRKFLPKYAVRATASVEGGLIPENMPGCNGAVGALYIHNEGDPGNPVPSYLAALENTLVQNGCVGTQSVVWPEVPNVCVQYTACPKDHPVVLCLTHGQGQSDQAGYAIPTFKRFFDSMAPG